MTVTQEPGMLLGINGSGADNADNMGIDTHKTANAVAQVQSVLGSAISIIYHSELV
jgi:hypothetical protein